MHSFTHTHTHTLKYYFQVFAAYPSCLFHGTQMLHFQTPEHTTIITTPDILISVVYHYSPNLIKPRYLWFLPSYLPSLCLPLLTQASKNVKNYRFHLSSYGIESLSFYPCAFITSVLMWLWQLMSISKSHGVSFPKTFSTLSIDSPLPN
jgi:hypothetical protein